MDFGELRMDSADLLDLLGGDGSPDNNNSLPFDGLDLSFMDHLGDPNPVKEEPVELTTGLAPSSDDVASPAGQDYHMDMPADGGLSTADEEPEPSGAATARPVVTTGEASGRKASTRAAAASQLQKKSKRSRRVRTPKQQELNRLAQQRYRERKKQKYSSLQQAVDALSEQLEKVAVVEEERDNLQAENDDLQEQLKGQAAKLHARDNVIKQQQKQLDAQQAEIAQLKQRLGALTSAESSTDVRLLQQLASAVKTAFEENDCSSAQMVLNQFPEMLMEHISKTVRQCCRELNAEAATPKPIPQVVQVSCC